MTIGELRELIKDRPDDEELIIAVTEQYRDGEEGPTVGTKRIVPTEGVMQKTTTGERAHLWAKYLP